MIIQLGKVSAMTKGLLKGSFEGVDPTHRQ